MTASSQSIDSDRLSRFDRNLDDSLRSTSDSPRNFDGVLPTSSSRWVEYTEKYLERRRDWILSSSRFGRKICEKLIVDERLMGAFARYFEELSNLPVVLRGSLRKQSTSQRSTSKNRRLIWSNARSRTSLCWISTSTRSLLPSGSRSRR